MPATQASLRVTERYRARMVAIRERAQADARRVWRRVSPADLDGTYQLGALTATVETLQREAARLSGAYLQSYIESELGRPLGRGEHPPTDALAVGSTSMGSIRETLRGPMFTTKRLIKEGRTAKEALAAGEVALVRLVGLATDNVARETLRRGMEDSEHVEGWRRAVRGTCGACFGGATGEMLPAGTPLMIHPNCFPAGTLVSGPAAHAATRRWYAGDLIQLRLRATLLAVTPNHPILTARGWVAAHVLREGDNVVRCLRAKRSIAGDPDKHERPVGIEQIAEALGRSGDGGRASVPVAALDFHGDGAGGNVDVVWTDSLAQNGRDAAFSDQLSEVPLGAGDADLSSLTSERSTGQLIDGGPAPARRFMSAVDPSTLDIERPSSECFERRFCAATDRNIGLGEHAPDAIASYPIPSGEGLLRHSGEIELDQLISVGRVPFSGHVYNLQTIDGWYIANTVVVHNCQCVAEPVVRGRTGWGARGEQLFSQDQARATSEQIKARRRAIETFRSPRLYGSMQTVLRHPTDAPEYLAKRWRSDSTFLETIDGETILFGEGHATSMETVAAELTRQARWLDDAIEKTTRSPGNVMPPELVRLTGMNHFSDDALRRLEAGETLSMSEPGILAATQDYGRVAREITPRTARGQVVFWRIRGGEALHSSVITGDIDEWLFRSGTRFTIRATDETVRLATTGDELRVYEVNVSG